MARHDPSAKPAKRSARSQGRRPAKGPQALGAASNTRDCGFVGVTWDKCEKKYKSRIRDGTKRVELGRFVTPEAAASAYDHAAYILKGEAAVTNFGVARVLSEECPLRLDLQRRLRDASQAFVGKRPAARGARSRGGGDAQADTASDTAPGTMRAAGQASPPPRAAAQPSPRDSQPQQGDQAVTPLEAQSVLQHQQLVGLHGVALPAAGSVPQGPALAGLPSGGVPQPLNTASGMLAASLGPQPLHTGEGGLPLGLNSCSGGAPMRCASDGAVGGRPVAPPPAGPPAGPGGWQDWQTRDDLAATATAPPVAGQGAQGASGASLHATAIARLDMAELTRRDRGSQQLGGQHLGGMAPGGWPHAQAVLPAHTMPLGLRSGLLAGAAGGVLRGVPWQGALESQPAVTVAPPSFGGLPASAWQAGLQLMGSGAPGGPYGLRPPLTQQHAGSMQSMGRSVSVPLPSAMLDTPLPSAAALAACKAASHDLDAWLASMSNELIE